MSGVFINYRCDDSGTAAALIDRELAARFGNDRVFLDCRSVPVGADFADVMLARLRSCTVLVVVMGPRWLNLTGDMGARRIDDPTDWVRCEIAEALVHGLRVIPVLVDGAELPTAGELPTDIAPLSGRQYAVLRHRHIDVDLSDLAERIAQAEPEFAAPVPHRQERPVRTHLPRRRLVPRARSRAT